MRVLIIGADGFEDSERLVPLYRCRKEGLTVGRGRVAAARPAE